MDMLETSSLFELSDLLMTKKQKKSEIEAMLEDIKAQIEAIEQAMVMSMLTDEVQNFKRDGVTFYISTRIFASVPEENKDEVFEWFKGHPDYNGMVKEQINANTLSAWVKERLSEEGMPEDLEGKLKIYEKTGIGARRT